jgi:hypothetical protein
MNGGTGVIAPLVQAFFTDYLVRQRHDAEVRLQAHILPAAEDLSIVIGSEPRPE